MFRTAVSRSVPWLLMAVLAIAGFVGLAIVGQLPALAQQAEKHQSSQQSLQRDRAYVRRLLERGTSDAKIESALALSTKFSSFNPGGDVQTYVRNLIAEEKANLKQTNQNPASTAVSQPVVAVALGETASVPANASSQAPSNSAGINSVKAAAQAVAQSGAQDNSQGVVQETIQNASEGDNRNAATAAPFPPAVGGILLSAASAASGGTGQSTLVSNNPSTQLSSTARSVEEQSGTGNSGNFNSAQGPGPGPIGPGPGCNLLPAPPSVGATVPLTYFGPPPSDVNQSFVGPVQLLKSGVIDAAHGTITLPLYLGHMKGSNKNVWYILTDVDDPNVAAELGLNFSAKLTFASNAARTANLDADGNLIFDKGTVDFSPVRSITPGPAGAEFPPSAAQPGAVGDADYSPFVKVLNAAGVIYNAPIVAFGVNASQITFPDGNVDYSRVHDEVVAIDPANMTVTINLINGFSFGRPVWYVSMDTSIPLGAAIEHNTFAPLMANLHLGTDDSFSSPIERIFISTNGPESGACNNPLRQGLSADLADGARPNNVLGGIPTIALDYSPAWDAQLFEWTADAISKGFRGQVREEFQILTFVQDGLITGPGGKAFGSSGFSINCPIAQRLD
jgi:hypothetical protein